MLQQKMKNRHLQMIAVGGSIGTGLFIGSGGALSVGGPAALIIDWLIVGFMVLMTCQAIGEMAILYPLSGGFYALAVRMLDPAWGFAMGWNYVLQWAVTLPLEITAAGITVSYWPAAQKVPLGAWITIFFVAMILINVFGTLGYAEEEFWSSCLKLLVVVIFIFIAVICVCGGGPSGGSYDHYIGGSLWHNPGAFANGFKGVCAVFVTAAFSFAGTELVGLAASETPAPRETVPSAIKNTFWRITIIYIISLLMIGLLVPYNDDFLLFADGDTAASSPFVRVLDLAHISGINHLINVTICISVLSIGLSCVYGGSRTLSALAETGYAPKFFAYVDKSGRPLWSVIFVLAFGPLGTSRLINTSLRFSSLDETLLIFPFLLSRYSLRKSLCQVRRRLCLAPCTLSPLHHLHMGHHSSLPYPLPQSMVSARTQPRRTPIPSHVRRMGFMDRSYLDLPRLDCSSVYRYFARRRYEQRPKGGCEGIFPSVSGSPDLYCVLHCWVCLEEDHTPTSA
jgi:amino acid transporter